MLAGGFLFGNTRWTVLGLECILLPYGWRRVPERDVDGPSEGSSEVVESLVGFSGGRGADGRDGLRFQRRVFLGSHRVRSCVTGFHHLSRGSPPPTGFDFQECEGAGRSVRICRSGRTSATAGRPARGLSFPLVRPGPAPHGICRILDHRRPGFRQRLLRRRRVRAGQGPHQPDRPVGRGGELGRQDHEPGARPPRRLSLGLAGGDHRGEPGAGVGDRDLGRTASRACWTLEGLLGQPVRTAR